MFRTSPARGERNAGKSMMPRVAVGFEQQLFDEIHRLAVAKRTSFGAQVRALVRKGLKNVDGVKR